MEEEVIRVPQYVEIDPTVLGIVVAVIIVAFLVLVFVYIPRTEELRKLREDLDRISAERDYAVEQWCIEMLKNRQREAQHSKSMQVVESRRKQADRKAKRIAEIYDKLKGASHERAQC